MMVPAEFVSDEEKTFQYQDTLPPLPQPLLEKTLQKYLDSVKPVLTDEEYLQTEFIVQQFGSGIGRTLQKKFLEQTANQKNWLEKLWEDKGYLEGRYPSAPLVNISGPGPYINHVWPPKEGTQIERGSILLHSMILFWEVIYKERLRVDRAGKTVIQCMHQYRCLFNSCRTPGLVKDKLNFYFKTEAETNCPNHVVVICKGRFFTVDVTHPGGRVLTPPELQVQLQYIRDVCDRDSPAPGLGALTADERTSWAKNMDHLLELHPSHQRHLEAIHKAIVVFVLDDREPADIHKLIFEGLCGDPCNRWFDKCVCQIVFKNGTVVSNCDHAPFDGLVYIYATYFSSLCVQKAQGKWTGNVRIEPSPPPKELIFHYDDKILKAIETAKALHATISNNIEAYCPTYKGYGKDFIRQFRLHPDAYAQLALQLAYYRLYKKPAPMYETATIRRFMHGRTETLRSCTSEAVTWVKAMLDNQATMEQKLMLMVAAIRKHLLNMKEATELQGCDRHLLALSNIANEEGIPTPTIFTDPAFKKSGGGGNFILSTSFVGYTPVIGGCAPMCQHGYGIFYSIQPQSLTFYITSWISDSDTNVRDMFRSLTVSLDDMRRMVEVAAPKMGKL